MSQIGTALLVLALFAASASALGWAGLARRPAGARSHRLASAARTGTALTFLAVAAATVLVEAALLRHDTSLNYVAMVSGEQLPVYYRVTALWSALEGSLLLWLLALALVAVLAVRHRSTPSAPEATRTRAAVGVVVTCSTAAFTAVTLMASPFTVPGSAVAARPSPLLQDHVAMGVHPPLLYAGFVALVVPYALALGGLATGEMGTGWAARMRRWAVSGWILLTAGIVLGAWWSYAVLGWGGYWAWDPVENASLLPWLTTTALLHTVAPRTRLGGWQTWAAGLGGAGFVLVLLATFLTRSGFVESIHAFTTSVLGPALLAILVLAILPWAVLMVRHRRKHTTTAPLVSRGTALQLHRVLLVLIMLVVLVGTVLPTVLFAVTGERLSVGPPWYHRTLAPLALVLLVAMCLGPWLPVRDSPPRASLRQLRAPALAAVLAVGVVAVTASEVWLALSAGIAVFALVSLGLVLGRRRGRDRLAVGAWIAHLGVAVGAVAVLAGTLGTVSQQSVPVGGTVTAGQTTATVVSLEGRDEGRRTVAAATLAVGRGGEFVETMAPELRWYPAERTMIAGPQIRTGVWRDVYVTLLDLDEKEGLVTLRVAETPLVGWLWASAGITVLGAGIAAWPRRTGTRRTSRPAPDVLTAEHTTTTAPHRDRAAAPAIGASR